MLPSVLIATGLLIGTFSVWFGNAGITYLLFGALCSFSGLFMGNYFKE
jgi:hypothetical protein